MPKDDNLRKIMLGNEDKLPPKARRWNRFLYYTYSQTFEEMTERVRPAAVAIQYDGLVQNGGHLDYFDTEDDHSLVHPSLLAIGATEHAQLFLSAYAHVHDDEYDYVPEDTAYYRMRPELGTFVEAYVMHDLADFSFEDL